MSDKDVDRFVAENEQHFGLLAIPENRHGQRFPYIPVKTIPLCLYVPKDSALAGKERIDFADLRDEKFLTLEKQSHYHSLLNDKAREAGFKPNKLLASADMDQLFALVNSGKGIFIAVDIPAVRAVYPNIAVVPFADETINYSIGVIFQDYEKLDRASRKFIEYIVERACIQGNKYNRGQD
jgi:DNA-binding transcriptional LysR family regulator